MEAKMASKNIVASSSSSFSFSFSSLSFEGVDVSFEQLGGLLVGKVDEKIVQRWTIFTEEDVVAARAKRAAAKKKFEMMKVKAKKAKADKAYAKARAKRTRNGGAFGKRW
ncbi:MAG: hypothetical protein L3J07_04060 [Candidatus Magasanikbacteria bacterium]|nr:hypothetical protein [Candidatus Magasanikbacteria bacterium]